jgi:hemolysin activation/secretion protein
VLPERQPEAAPPLQITPAPEEPTEESRQIVKVHDVEIEGATVYPAALLTEFYAGIVDRPTALGDITSVIQRIQAKYRGDGYFLTVVRGTVEPEGDAVNVHIRVVEGFISSVKLDGDIGPAGVQVYRFLDKLTGSRPTKIKDVERALLLAQDVPGVSVRAVLRPGTGEPGAVDLIAQVGRAPFSGLGLYDNRASPLAGPSELLLGGYANSFTSFGERSELIVYDTPFNDQQVFGQAALEGFVGASGLKLRGFVGYGPSNPGGPLAQSGFKGQLLLAGLSTSYPLIRTRPLSLYLSAAFDISQSQIDLIGSPSRQESNLRIVRLGENLTFQDDTLGLGITGANLLTATFHQGIDGLGSSRNSDTANSPRFGNVVDFHKLSGELTRVQDLFQVSKYQFALKLSIGGQYTDDILPPSEKYFVGGTRFGRGFFSGEVTGDRALGSTVELQINTGIEFPWRIGLQPYWFYDNGLTWDLDPAQASHRIESTGIGLRIAPKPQVSGEVELTHRFTRQPAGANTSREGANAILTSIIVHF